MSNQKQEELLQEFEKAAQEFHLLPTKVTDFYAKKVQEEIDAVGIGGPLYRCVYPTEEKLTLHGPGEVEDFVQEYNHYPVSRNPDIVRQYPNRLLLMTTEACVSNCAYCFRTIKLAESNEIQMEDSLELLIPYLKEHPEVEEVIISGGDAVLVSTKRLREIFEKVRSVGVKHLRLHTRSIVYNPHLITDELIDLLSKYDVRVVFHIMHPYEIDDTVRAKVEQMRKANIRMYNQHPLLHGINDDPIALKEMYTMLDDMRVRQMSAFTPDIIAFSATYRVPYQKMCDIYDWINYNSSGWVNSNRLVSAIPPGKARRENIVRWDKKNGIITFAIQGVEFNYVDFPEELYQDPGRLMWKEEDQHLYKQLDRDIYRINID